MLGTHQDVGAGKAPGAVCMRSKINNKKKNSLPSAIRCSGTCRTTRTERLQERWEEYTRLITQLITLISVRVVLLMGLRGEPAAGGKYAEGEEGGREATSNRNM